MKLTLVILRMAEDLLLICLAQPKFSLWVFAGLTRENVRTLKRLAQRLFPAVRLYNDSDEIQSTVTEVSASTLA